MFDVVRGGATGCAVAGGKDEVWDEAAGHHPEREPLVWPTPVIRGGAQAAFEMSDYSESQSSSGRARPCSAPAEEVGDNYTGR